MARLNFVTSARKNIYEKGKTVPHEIKKGKRVGEKTTKLDRTIPRDESDKILIAQGDSYYWWQFKNSSKQYSKERPRNSQLTQSAYLSTLYDIQDRISEISADAPDELESQVDEIKSEIEDLRDETQSSLDNMPESLQYSPTGELLQERIDSLDNALSEFESLEFDYDEPSEDELKEDIADEAGIDTDLDGWEDEITEEALQEKKDSHLQEWIDEKVGEIRDIVIE